VGKDIIASSVSLLIQSMAHKVTNIEIDSYINLDVATLSPTE
jgi:CTP synthase (UTP-ammonia lyase)